MHNAGQWLHMSYRLRFMVLALPLMKVGNILRSHDAVMHIRQGLAGTPWQRRVWQRANQASILPRAADIQSSSKRAFHAAYQFGTVSTHAAQRLLASCRHQRATLAALPGKVPILASLA